MLIELTNALSAIAYDADLAIGHLESMTPPRSATGRRKIARAVKRLRDIHKTATEYNERAGALACAELENAKR